MDIEKDSLKKQIREMTQLGYIAPEDLPSIELYMDQVTTFMDKYLSQNKRYEEDKTLTKTMISFFYANISHTYLHKTNVYRNNYSIIGNISQ